MKIAVLGDIHSNSEALESVLTDIKNENVDKIIHTGDVVGYCTDIEECITRLVSENISGVHGNHDLMAIGEMATDDCIRSGIKAIHWTWNHITNEQKEYLAKLPKIMTVENIVIFHATPKSVLRRIRKPEDAEEVTRELNENYNDWWIGVHGHVHKQHVFENDGNSTTLVHRGQGSIKLRPDKKYIICPGSVGVSRDFDYRTSYMLIDTKAAKITMRRIDYDWRSCTKKIRAAGLETKLYLHRTTYLKRKTKYHFWLLVQKIKKGLFNRIITLD